MRARCRRWRLGCLAIRRLRSVPTVCADCRAPARGGVARVAAPCALGARVCSHSHPPFAARSRRSWLSRRRAAPSGCPAYVTQSRPIWTNPPARLTVQVRDPLGALCAACRIRACAQNHCVACARSWPSVLTFPAPIHGHLLAVWPARSSRWRGSQRTARRV